MEKIKGIGNFKERWIIYIAQYLKHKALYIVGTREQLSEHFSKDCYDIRNKPDKSDLAKYYHKNCDVNLNLNVTILENNTKTLALHVLNTEIDDYAKEIHNFYFY